MAVGEEPVRNPGAAAKIWLHTAGVEEYKKWDQEERPLLKLASEEIMEVDIAGPSLVNSPPIPPRVDGPAPCLSSKCVIQPPQAQAREKKRKKKSERRMTG